MRGSLHYTTTSASCRSASITSASCGSLSTRSTLCLSLSASATCGSPSTASASYHHHAALLVLHKHHADLLVLHVASQVNKLTITAMCNLQLAHIRKYSQLTLPTSFFSGNNNMCPYKSSTHLDQTHNTSISQSTSQSITHLFTASMLL
jgi:hypothetical protein